MASFDLPHTVYTSHTRILQSVSEDRFCCHDVNIEDLRHLSEPYVWDTRVETPHIKIIVMRSLKYCRKMHDRHSTIYIARNVGTQYREVYACWVRSTAVDIYSIKNLGTD